MYCPSDHLKVVNDELRAFKEMYAELDGLIVIKIDDLDWVYEYVLVAFFSVV